MMKRKLALLLAAVMVIAAMPMTLFAATSENRLTKSGLNVPDYTLFYETGVPTGGVSGTVTDNKEKIEYWVDGSNLVIEVKDPITQGLTGEGAFPITLTNARFFFRVAEASENTLTTTGKLAPAVITELEARYPAMAASGDVKSKGYVKDFGGTGLGNANSTFSLTNGVYNDFKYLRLPASTPAYADPDAAVLNDIPYVMEISMADERSATVKLLRDAKRGDQIIIPIVARSTGTNSDVRVTIGYNRTSISVGDYLLSTTGGGRTRARATGSVTSRSDFNLETLVIDEQRIGSIKTGAGFELRAPSGYSFADINKIGVYTEGGLSWIGHTGRGYTEEPTGWTPPTGWPTDSGGVPLPWRSDYVISYRERSGREDRSVLEFDMRNLLPSTNITGSIVLTDVLLISDDPDLTPTTGRELTLSIRNLGNGTSYTEESFTVGKVSDYIVNMTRVKDEIPELVSGRLDSYITYDTGIYGEQYTIRDEHHKAAVVRIEEAIPNAWWAERTTEFTLPEQVRVLKAKFKNVTNLDSDAEDAIVNNTNSLSGQEFYNTGSRVNSAVTIKDNVLTLSRLRVASNESGTTKKAKFDLELWLNIDVAFEGDIDLTLAGSAVTNDEDTPSVTIARAIRPVEVNTKVTDIRIGYQYVTVADFDIVETKAGNLQQGETTYVSVTDEISVDMNIARGFTASVTDGNLKISNVTLRSALGYAGEQIDGQLRFDIDRASTEASTISFTNVQVKVDNTVPNSNLSIGNDRGINLVVWGSAIAQNYEGLISGYRNDIAAGATAKLNTRDFFSTPGIRAKYINVTTPAPGGINEFTNIVRVSIGNPVILIGEDQYTMPVAAYISPASNSTMVPVRFVSLALGLPETAVKWDPQSSTCTVDAGSRIVQFQTGNANYLVNGVSVPMTSPDGLPVEMEINEERAFVPFRALGEAFGITVSWEGDSNTAVYNAPEKQ